MKKIDSEIFEYLQLEISRLQQSRRELGFTLYTTLGVLVAGVYGVANSVFRDSIENIQEDFLISCSVIYLFLLLAFYVLKSQIRGSNNHKLHFSSNLQLSYLNLMSTGIILSLALIVSYIWIVPEVAKINMIKEDLFLLRILLTMCLFAAAIGFLLWRRNIFINNRNKKNSNDFDKIFNMNYLNFRYNYALSSCIITTNLTLILSLVTVCYYLYYHVSLTPDIILNGFILGSSLIGVICGIWLLFDLASKKSMLKELKDLERFIVFNDLETSHVDLVIKNMLYIKEPWEYVENSIQQVESIIEDEKELYDRSLSFLFGERTKKEVLKIIYKRLNRISIYFEIMFQGRYKEELNSLRLKLKHGLTENNE